MPEPEVGKQVVVGATVAIPALAIQPWQSLLFSRQTLFVSPVLARPCHSAAINLLFNFPFLTFNVGFEEEEQRVKGQIVHNEQWGIWN